MGNQASGTTKKSVGRTAKSSSFAKTVKSKTKLDVLELGVEIVRQLGERAEDDLLASWMAEYLGERISEVKRAHGKQRTILEKECAELILKLWGHRHHLPNGARPLESFEPIFVVLNELSQDRPRHSLLRNLPPIDTISEVGRIVQGVLAIDKSASALIRYFLAEAVEKIPKSDKRWTNIRTAIKPSNFDINIVYILIDDSESMSGKQEKLKKQQREKLESMLGSLESFEKSTASLRVFLEEILKTTK